MYLSLGLNRSPLLEALLTQSTGGTIMKVGITEQGDAGLDFSWINKLQEANIIISKNLNNQLIESLIKNQKKIIFHLTCTGFGKTVVEPNVPSIDFTATQLAELLLKGFPIKQVVLRADPIIPTKRGISVFKTVLDTFKNFQIQRVRYSFVDMYPHVKQRFINAGFPEKWLHVRCRENRIVKSALKV